MTGEAEPSWVRDEPPQKEVPEPSSSAAPGWMTPNAKNGHPDRKTPMKSVMKYKDPQVSQPETDSTQSFDMILLWIKILHIVSVILCIGMTFVNIFLLVKVALEWNEYVVRVYSILFYLLMALVEFDLQCIVQQVKALQHWIYRGLFYGFLGVITCMLTQKNFEKCPNLSYLQLGREDSTTLLPNIIGISVMVVGFIYIILVSIVNFLSFTLVLHPL